MAQFFNSIPNSLASYDARGGIIIEHKTWNMRETFCFPGYGCPTEIAAVQIKPQWQTMQLEDSLRLMGIYHITAHVRFDFQDMQAFNDKEELIKIDALDIQGDTGYFEYAVPLHVDLPKDSALEDLMVKDVRPTLTNQMCQLEWTVTSIFNESELVLENASAFDQQSTTAKAEKAMIVEETAPLKQHVDVSAPIEEQTVVNVASAKLDKLEASEQKTVLRESSSHIVVRESSSWQEVPSMIWDLEEGYTPLKVRVSNDII
ncbi:valyl-tRNA synthetase [Lysinibacillus pakistanensis]|uniref:Valyl-tRNA synthetase n=2 Tax=Lysinibacillus pakistanensis TaxID=759811 RepID=A0ABX6DCL9_9BACI|nr:valyl-tRNA synthetase [Lysinibacillus pakistanensis]